MNNLENQNLTENENNIATPDNVKNQKHKLKPWLVAFIVFLICAVAIILFAFWSIWFPKNENYYDMYNSDINTNFTEANNYEIDDSNDFDFFDSSTDLTFEMSDYNYENFVGATVNDVIERFGNNYSSNFFNGYGAFNYKNGPIFYWTDYIGTDNFNLATEYFKTPPDPTAKIRGYWVDFSSQSAEICYGVKIGDSINSIDFTEPTINCTSGGFAITYLEDANIKWIYDDITSKIIAVNVIYN